MIDIVMLTTSNRWQFTQQAITEIAWRTTLPYRLIVVDNGTNAMTSALLAEAVYDGLVYATVLLSSEYDGRDTWSIGGDLSESHTLFQTTDTWLPPGDAPRWPEDLQAAMAKHPEYVAIALRPSFYPRGIPRLEHDGELLQSPWLEPSFACYVRGRSRVGLKVGYLSGVYAEYLPSAALAWH